MKKEDQKEFEAREKLLSDLEYSLITDFIKLRKENHLSQQDMANASKTIRETIAKIENKIVSPQINTLIKILEPLGYTLGIVKIENKDKDNMKETSTKIQTPKHK